MRGLMPVDIVELVLRIQAIDSNMKEEYMAFKHDFDTYRLMTRTIRVQFVARVLIERGT